MTSVQPLRGMNALRVVPPVRAAEDVLQVGIARTQPPVSAAVWLNDVWMRSVFWFTNVGRTST